MTDNNNEMQSIGEIKRRLDIVESNISKNTDQIASIREGNIKQSTIIDQMIEDRKDAKKTNEKIFAILDLFKTEFVEIKQEMVYNKQFRVDQKQETIDIRKEQLLMRDDIEELKLTPAKEALREKKDKRKQKISVFFAIAGTVVAAVVIHFLFLL